MCKHQETTMKLARITHPLRFYSTTIRPGVFFLVSVRSYPCPLGLSGEATETETHTKKLRPKEAELQRSKGLDLLQNENALCFTLK